MRVPVAPSTCTWYDASDDSVNPIVAAAEAREFPASTETLLMRKPWLEPCCAVTVNARDAAVSPTWYVTYVLLRMSYVCPVVLSLSVSVRPRGNVAVAAQFSVTSQFVRSVET